MCGIVGVFNFASTTRPVTDELIARMRDTMAHRGPDDCGLWVRGKGNVGLGHRRLSIIDLSPDGRQPMASEDQAVWITFNGEIYNFAELRRDLERRGHRFRSHTDTEVIVHLYEEHAERCLDQLDGMFAFALWDEGRERLFLARDRLGVKPLYYAQVGGTFLFASEIKAILAHPAVSRDIDPEALYHYLTFRTTPAPLTMFAGIRKLPAGCYLTCDRSGSVRVTRYWDALATAHRSAEKLDEEEVVGTIRDLLSKSVGKRLIADVPTGVFLSGGLDSSAIVALLAPQVRAPLNTFSIGIGDLEGHNELEYARQVADRFGTHHREILIGRKEVEAYLPLLVHHQDEPLADPVCVPLYYLSKLARESGVVVVQVGEGSDEQFIGYDSRISFLRSYQRKWGPLLRVPRPLLHAMGSGVALVHATTARGGRLRKQLAKAARGDELFYGSVGFEEGPAKWDLLNGNAAFLGFSSQRIVRETLEPLRSAWPARDIGMEVSFLDIKIRLAELLLMRVDKVTMSVGVEAREPFLDYRLVELLMGLPLRLKLKGGHPKYLLKRAMAGVVPDNIISRPKKAFAAPVNVWLRSGLEPYARRTVQESRLRDRGLLDDHAIDAMFGEHVAGRRDYGVQLWTLMNLSAWYDHWIAGAAVN
jgi:asparagine synthase (glutamine-hydrolysing)